MARFPIQRAEKTIPGVGPSVRADVDVRTGEQGIAGLGFALMELGVKWDVIQGKTQADNALRDARLSYVKMLNEINQPQLDQEGRPVEDDISRWDSAFNAHKQRVSELTPKNKRGARQYNSYINNLIPIWQEGFNRLKTAKLDDNMKAASIVKVNDLLNSATIENMDLVVTKIKTELEVRDRLSPSVTKEETEIAKSMVEHDVEISIAKKMALSSPEALLEKIKGDKIEGFDKLTPDDVLRLRNMANSTITQAKMGIKQKDDAIGMQFFNLLINKMEPTKPQLTFDMIAQSNLSLDAKMEWETRLRVFDSYSESELAEAFQDKPTIMAKILPAVARREITDPATELKPLIGKGLSPETYASIVKDDYFWTDYWFKESDDFLKRNLGWSSKDEVFMHPEGSISYDAALRELRKAVMTENLRGQDIEKKATEIGLPYLIDYWRNILTLEEERILKMSSRLMGEGLPEKIPPETKPETKPKVQPKKGIDPDNIFGNK